MANSPFRSTAPASANNTCDRFEVDRERVIPRPDGCVSQATVSLGDRERLDGYVVVTTVSTPRGRLILETVEARQLLEGGLAHIQVHLHPLGMGCSVIQAWIADADTLSGCAGGCVFSREITRGEARSSFLSTRGGGRDTLATHLHCRDMYCMSHMQAKFSHNNSRRARKALLLVCGGGVENPHLRCSTKGDVAAHAGGDSNEGWRRRRRIMVAQRFVVFPPTPVLRLVQINVVYFPCSKSTFGGLPPERRAPPCAPGCAFR